MDYDIVTILGPTATGKTQIAAQLPDSFDELIVLTGYCRMKSGGFPAFFSHSNLDAVLMDIQTDISY